MRSQRLYVESRLPRHRAGSKLAGRVLARDTERVLRPVPRWTGPVVGCVALAATAGLDVVLGTDVALVGPFAVAPFLTAAFGGPRATAVVAVLAIGCGAASGLWNDNTGSDGWFARLAIIAAAGVFATLAARVADRARTGTARLRLLDRVGRIADGSLPLAETLDRITDAVVPGFADLCMIDAIHDGDVRRIAVRAAGEDAPRVEEHIRNRTPSTPDWLRDPASTSLDPHFVGAMPDEVLRQMANDAEDLEFLRWLRPGSYIVAPLVSRSRSLGALTVVRMRRSPRLRAEDVEFVTVLASRIGIALDNAGLFSDLESIERRMDTVMENVAEAVIVHDAGGNVVYANRAAAELQDLISAKPGAPVRRFEISREGGEPLDADRLPRRLTIRGEDPQPTVFRLYDPDTGQESWRLEKSTSIRGPSGEVLYAVTTIQDVTAVKQGEFAQSVLADTAEALASAVDYESALEALAKAVVPRLADWCSVSVPTLEGGIEQVAVAERDPAMLELDRGLEKGLPVGPGRTISMEEVLKASTPVTAELPSEPVPGWVLLKPIRTGGGAIGVLTLVNRAGRRAFSAAEIQLARAIADRAGVAILNARLASERTEIAETLQRELMPPLLPEVPGWSMAAMYRPAGEQNRAGGDFYDVFEGRREWMVVVGDVEGHGAEAASLTAMVRYTIRTAVMLEGDLLAALAILNRELRSRDRARLCSVACVSFGPGNEATVISAGHPPPLLTSSGTIREVGLPGSLLGALEVPQWSPVRFEVEPGDELAIYTDGVIEARQDGGERFGRDRLASLLRQIGRPGDAVQRVGDEIESFAGAIQDDAALVVLRREQQLEPSARSGSRAGRELLEGIE
jgi:serine phosphatase RsbU (regulator of sigma subunit)/PAS domain-containing protein